MFLIMILVLMIFISGQRFVLSEPVVDKETKMRETMRIMSMRSSVYGLSYFITQAIFSLFTALIVTIAFGLLKFFSAQDGVIFFITLALYGLSMIFKALALSTLFSDSKVASQIGSLILLGPMSLMMYLFSIVSNTGDVRYMYIGYFLPFVPTMVIIGGTLRVRPYDELNMPIAWISLILSLPFYYALYIYLDQIVPDTYGISRGCCFCLRRRKRQGEAQTGGSSMAAIQIQMPDNDQTD